jgi:hypothetical protein
MQFNTKYNIGDFVCYNYQFGTISDIRIYCSKNKKFNIKYMINGCDNKWIFEEYITLSSEIEANKYYSSREITTTDDIY